MQRKPHVQTSEISGVEKSIIDAMFVSLVVRRALAEKVLAAVSQYTGQTWNFTNVKVALLPTFQDLHVAYRFDEDQ